MVMAHQVRAVATSSRFIGKALSNLTAVMELWKWYNHLPNIARELLSPSDALAGLAGLVKVKLPWHGIRSLDGLLNRAAAPETTRWHSA